MNDVTNWTGGEVEEVGPKMRTFVFRLNAGLTLDGGTHWAPGTFVRIQQPSNGLGTITALSDAEIAGYKLIKSPVTHTTGRRLAARTTKSRETLTVPKAHPPLNPKAGTISDRILSTVGTTPMAAKEIVAAVGGNPSNTRSALVRMAKSGALKSTARGMYQLGRR